MVPVCVTPVTVLIVGRVAPESSISTQVIPPALQGGRGWVGSVALKV
jgi:hypothetical protein